MEKRLLNKKVIVTGGSRGIGAGIVKRLFNEGAEIIIADIKEDLATKLMESLDSEKINFVHTDLSKEEEIINLIDFTKNKWGALDILINNAGIEDGFMLSDQSYEKYRKTMRVNLDAPFLCSKYALPLLEKSQSGRIIMISSIQGVRGYKGNISYNTAKGWTGEDDEDMNSIGATYTINDNMSINASRTAFESCHSEYASRNISRPLISEWCESKDSKKTRRSEALSSLSSEILDKPKSITYNLSVTIKLLVVGSP